MAEEKKIATGHIGNALRSTAADHTTTFADEIFDTERQQYQNEVNTDLETTDIEIKADLESETARATAAEQANAQAIEDETARAKAAEQAEATRATTEEERLQGEIDNTNNNLNSLDDKVNSNHDHLTDEVARLDELLSIIDKRKTILNVNAINDIVYTDETSRAAIPQDIRKKGSILLYRTSDGGGSPNKWSIQMYLGANDKSGDTFWNNASWWMKIIDGITFSELESRVNIKAYSVTKAISVEGYYINYYNGELTNAGTSAYDATDYIDISSLNIIYLWLSAGNLAGAAFYTEEKSFISGFKNSTDIGKEFNVERPLNAKYIRVSVKNDELDKFFVVNSLFAISIDSISNELGNNKGLVASQYLLNKVYKELKGFSSYVENVKIIPSPEDNINGIVAADGTIYNGPGADLWRYKDYFYVPSDTEIEIRFSRGNSIGYAFYDSEKRYISGEAYSKGTQGEIYKRTSPPNAAYMRACYQYEEDKDRWYISFKSVKASSEKFNQIDEEVENIKNTKANKDIVDISLPSKLYVGVGIDCGIYYENITDVLLGCENQVRIIGAGENYKRLWRYNPKSNDTNKELSYRVFDMFLKDVSNGFKNTLVTVPKSGLTGTKYIMFNGDSNTQRGLYSSYAFEQLKADGDFTPILLGRWGFEDNAHREGLGSTGLSFFTTKQGISYLAQVTGLTEEASTNLVAGGSVYRDSAGTDFTVRANKAASGSGYMELVGNKAPQVGTLTKQSGSGSETVNIESFEEINQNPFWNTETDSLDFSWYISKYGFSAPDVWCISFTNNDFKEDASDEAIDNIVNNTFNVYIDKLHSQYPNCKIIISVNSMRSENSIEDFYMRAKSNRYFCRKLIEVFQGSEEYNSFVTICPTFAWVDRKLGFNNSDKVISTRTELKESIANDSAHSNEVGYHQWGDCFYSIIRGVLLGL